MSNTFSIQDDFLGELCAQRQFSSIYLINGMQLKVIINGFDQAVIILENTNKTNTQIVYKHAISTIVPFGSNNNPMGY